MAAKASNSSAWSSGPASEIRTSDEGRAPVVGLAAAAVVAAPVLREEGRDVGRRPVVAEGVRRSAGEGGEVGEGLPEATDLAVLFDEGDRQHGDGQEDA